MKNLEETKKTEEHIQKKATSIGQLVDDCGLELVFASSNAGDSGEGGPSRKSIFGDATPVDTSKREREIDDKLRSQINDGANRNSRSMYYSNLMETPFVADKNERYSKGSQIKKKSHGGHKYKRTSTKPKDLHDHIYKKMCFLYALWNLADNNDCYQLYEQFLHHSTELMKLSIKETGNVSFICSLGGSPAKFRVSNFFNLYIFCNSFCNYTFETSHYT